MGSIGPGQPGPLYFGQPRLLTGRDAALSLLVTEDGTCPPAGTNHTSTRRISAEAAPAAPTDPSIIYPGGKKKSTAQPQ